MTDDDRSKGAWNPYVAGALVGLLMVFSVWVTGKYFGASTTFVRATGFVEQSVSGERVKALEYFKQEAPKIDWQFLFVVGIFFGSLISALMSRSFRATAVPPMWQGRFGPSKTRRGVVAFLGGCIGMFGARLADG